MTTVQINAWALWIFLRRLYSSRLQRCWVAFGLALACSSCRTNDLYVHNKSSQPVTVTVPGQTTMHVSPGAHKTGWISTKAPAMEIIVETATWKRAVRCPCPHGSDVLDVQIEANGRIACAGI